ncbi:hypothetical protein [Flavobacterium algicola]|nr:hypothetical protein [Flavobacterium algicola]MCG9793006.1 hypothetical protein [Flavobacterium algicola]
MKDDKKKDSQEIESDKVHPENKQDDSTLNTEVETDADGNKTVVHRARK